MLMLTKLVAHSAVLTSMIIVIAIVFLIIEAFSPHTYGALGVLGFCFPAGLLYAYDATGVGYWFG